MKVVVVGASGFLGAATAARLRGRAAQVTTVSRRASSADVQVADYSATPVGDVLIHLAQDGDRGRVNSLGQRAEQEAAAILDTLLSKGFRRIVYVSSAALYGDASLLAHPPGDPVSAVDSYTRIKRASEAAVLSETNGIILRMANVYGPGMSAANVLSKLLRQIPGEGDVEVFDTAPVRDFVWHVDAADAIAAAALANTGGVLNVGTGIGTSVRDLAQIALQIVGQPYREIRSQHPSTRCSHLVLDCSATRSQLGWRSRISVQQGLQQLLGRA